MALANLYMLSVWDDLHDNAYAYYRQLPYQTWPNFAGAAGKLLLLGLLFWLLLEAVERVQTTLARKTGCLVFAGLFLVGLDVARVKGLRWYGDVFFQVLGKSGTFIVLGGLFCVGLYQIVVHERAALREIRRVLLILLLLVPLNLASTAWAIHTSWPAERYAPQKLLPVLPPTGQAPRFIWVIFDEWDQHLTFRNRAPGLALPELDRFRDQALFGETVFPPARNTLESLPSLITGRLVRRTQAKTPDDLLLTFCFRQLSWAHFGI
jgi:hypothetical protein